MCEMSIRLECSYQFRVATLSLNHGFSFIIVHSCVPYLLYFTDQCLYKRTDYSCTFDSSMCSRLQQNYFLVLLPLLMLVNYCWLYRHERFDLRPSSFEIICPAQISGGQRGPQQTRRRPSS